MTRWLEAAHDDRRDDARYHAREIGVVGRLLACQPGFKRVFADLAAGGSPLNAEDSLRSIQLFLTAVVDSAGLRPADREHSHGVLSGSVVGPAQEQDMETAAFRSHLVWSGRECVFPKAGVYYGLAPCRTHHTAAAGLLPRRGAVYTGARTEVKSGQTLPLFYFAVRDPSAVRVVPVKGVAKAGDPGHVSLVFPLAGLEPAARGIPSSLSNDEVEALDAIRAEADRNTQGGFVVTIGLRKDRELDFFEKVLMDPAVQPFGGLCERIQSAAADFNE